ncbi:MAG: hypothetical protein PG978_000731 [Wolbachia endosymbiont of Ctenocephalides felis wCfeF]|nr:MAG: hypothetical protein PG978_000731 [Wolbachia endosymbiont of Ctenocephalides felis wCfeF]
MVECGKNLINKEAGVNIEDSEGETALDALMGIVTEMGFTSMTKLFRNQELIDTAEQGNLDKVKELIDSGADLNATDNYGMTPLHYAALNGKLSIVKYLIEYLEKTNSSKLNEFINAKANGGKTPFNCAIRNGKLNIVKYLVKRGVNDKHVVWYNLMAPVATFTGRGNKLKALHDKLQSNSPAVSIIGLGGVGKSELARKYIYQYYKYYDSNAIWINAETQESLKKSFQELAKRLEIPVKEKRDKKIEERDIKSIVNDVYKYFYVIKGLFIFDNAEEYKDINEFLPSSFSSFSGDKKPYILITSRNQKWKENIELLPLDVFTSKEATEFTKKFLRITSSEQDKDIKKLAEKLQYYPLALYQILLYIGDRNESLKLRGEKKLEIRDALEEYEKTPEKLLNFELDPEFRSDRYTKTTFTTWEVTIENIKQKECGQEALNILEVAAYFATNEIPIEKLFSKLTADKERLWSALDLLEQYSMVNVKQGILSIHTLVQQVIRLRLQKQGKKGEKLIVKNY